MNGNGLRNSLRRALRGRLLVKADSQTPGTASTRVFGGAINVAAKLRAMWR